MTPALAAAIQAVIDDLANHPAVLVRGRVERLREVMEAERAADDEAYNSWADYGAVHAERARILAGIEGLLKPESVV